jgi:predicted nucleic acid-binding protein
MNRVVDASVVVEALLDAGRYGTWSREVLSAGGLAAPHHLPAEVANVLRRGVASGRIPAQAANLAHADLLSLPVTLYAFEPLAERVWELRGTVATFDAWYVALAERLDLELATLDARLVRAAGPGCRFHTAPFADGPGRG